MSDREHMEDFLGSLSVEQIEQLNRMLSQHQKPPKKDDPASPDVSVNDDFTVNRGLPKKGKAPVSGGENTWEDTGELKDIETPDFERTPRNRPAPRTKEVSCHVCSKGFVVNESLLYGEFYRCNRCTGK